MIKFRSLLFFREVNPSILNGGLYGDSKMMIYSLLPKGTFPKTILITKNTSVSLEEVILHNQFQFPLIVKPDIGLRGRKVAIVNTMEELKLYSIRVSGSFLIQEWVSLPNEIGLFYYRIPGNKHGKVSGITLKKFLFVKGTGRETIKQLLRKECRSKMQIGRLKNQINLMEIIPEGKEVCLVPFGNHSRGTQFLDGREYITEKLESTMNSILGSINGFYFGRLDIRYNTFEELEEGRNFSIIELNGVKSEPTHIYDPSNNFWSGQREIFRHQRIMMQVLSGQLPSRSKKERESK